MIRDKIKNESYFEAFIDSEMSRIIKFSEARNNIIEKRGKDDRGVKSANLNLFNFSLHLLIASYSVGKPIKEVRDLFQQVCDWFLQLDSISYSDAIRVVSLCILFDYDEYRLAIKNKIIESKLVDKFMKFLLQDASLVSSFEGFSKYDDISNIENSTNKPKIIKDYLSSWYLDNSESYWYDSHNSKNNVYFGYWCFESTATVKLLSLNPCDFNDLTYFPNDFL